ncbi:MAG: phage tail protein [bacterium]|nr:phage tail protein [bacterium]
MPVTFLEIPASTRRPGVYTEVDPSLAAGPSALAFKALMIGQRTDGSVAELVPTRIVSAAQARDRFGHGSMLHLMATAWFENNRSTELWVVALDDDAGAVAATGSIGFSVTTASAGTLYLMIAGQKVRVAVAAGSTAAQIASAVAAAITNRTSLPVTAAVNGGDTTLVDITAKNAGVIGNDVDVRLNYFQGEEVPLGVTPTITAMAGGTGAVDLDEVWPVVGEEQYNVLVAPYTDGSNMLALGTELADRWGALRQIEGHAFSAHSGTHSAVGAFGDGQNSPHVTVFASFGSPSTPWEWATAAAGQIAISSENDPALPSRTLPLDSVLAPSLAARFTNQERELLLFDGISTTTVDRAGIVRIERPITLYQVNAAGADDIAYLDITTLYTLALIRHELRTLWSLRYSRHKLAQDGTQFGPGQRVMTPLLAKGIVIGQYRGWVTRGLVDSIEDFADEVVAEINPQDPTRLDLQLPPRLVNPLFIVAAQIQFRL